MADQIGRMIVVPYPPASGLTFPLTSDYPTTYTRPWPLVTHRFGELATLATQRFQVGVGPRRFSFIRSALSFPDRAALTAFYQARQGGFSTFIYHAPNQDGSTTAYTVMFDTAPLSVTSLANMCKTGFTMTEAVTSATFGPYTSTSTCVRFPNSTLTTALLSQVQIIIPLLHIKVRDPAVPDVYISDRRVTVNGQLYLPRVLNIGDAGSDVIMSQDLSGRADNVQFTLGNADRVMSRFIQDTSLKFAEIDLNLLHVNSLTLLQLWKGIVISFQSDGTAEFKLTCSDGLYPVTQNYPRRTITRECWKTFNDGLNCPWATTPGHTGSASSCDYFFNSANGCLSHGMQNFFGGHPMFPQSVIIKDNGTGIIGGFFRNTVTSTSILNDSIQGLPLPEIWCNDDGNPANAFLANATVCAVRDESTYEDILGIVGVGPLGGYENMAVVTNADGFKFFVAPVADGFPPQSFKLKGDLSFDTAPNGLGVREVVGTDPAQGFTDVYGNTWPATFALGQGTPQVWTVPDLNFGTVSPIAAGTAFVELRYQKATGGGITPTTAESHSMSVPISTGLTGVTFDALGNRRSVSGLTNPFWVCVSTYLRALGIDKAPAATQVASFDLASVFKGDGSGCAEIADLQVTPVLGTTTLETQYRFQGTLAEFKPFRDWMTEILSCCLGYFVFEFGQLKLGIRENARASSSFTVGSMLYQSLTLAPMETAFEYLKIDFANVAYQYQLDMVEYQDKDHAAYFNRAGAPLTSRMRSVGLSTTSQALRIAVTRVRESIGGILRNDQPNPYVEWDNALTATWKTTILALETEVGQVVSITHPDIPTYPGPVAGSPGAATYVPQPPNTWNYRIQRWTLHGDWSITITATSVTDSMYDLDVGPKPTDVLPTALPVLWYPIPSGIEGPAWAPHQVQANAADALFPSEWTFDTDEEYVTDANGWQSTTLTITGVQPTNTFSPTSGAPVLGTISTATTGGSLPGGQTYAVAVVCYDANGLPSPPSQITLVQTPAGTNTNKITFVNVIWPKVTGLSAYAIFASDHQDLICFQTGSTLLASGDGTVYSPTTISLSGPLSRSTYALPTPFVKQLRLKAKLEINGGCAGAGVTSIATNQIVCSDLIDAHSSPVSWVNHVISCIGRSPGSTPYASFNITGFDPATGTLTLDRDPTGILAVNDAVVIRMRRDPSSTTTSFIDLTLENVTNSYNGLTDPLAGETLRVIAGLGRGETRNLTGNTVTSVTWDLPLTLDATSIVIIEEASWRYVSDSGYIMNSDPTRATSFTVPVDNYTDQPMVVSMFTVDVTGVESSEGDNPIREDWIFGSQGNRTVTADATLLPTDGTVYCDTTSGNITITCLPSILIPNQIVIVSKISSDANTVTILPGGTDILRDGLTSIVLTDNGVNGTITLKFSS